MAEESADHVIQGAIFLGNQAKFFDEVLAKYDLDVMTVVLLTVDDDEIIRRVSHRWSCPTRGCKATYHTQINPPKVPGICDDCHAQLVQRDDDKAETVIQRLVVYHRDTAELIPYYKARGLLFEVPGHGEIEQVYNNIMKVLQALQPRA